MEAWPKLNPREAVGSPGADDGPVRARQEMAQVVAACAVCHLYWRLYKLRNDVAHGNPVRKRKVAARAGQHKGARIDQVAPLLFRECVLERLRRMGVVKRAEGGRLHSWEHAEDPEKLGEVIWPD